MSFTVLKGGDFKSTMHEAGQIITDESVLTPCFYILAK